MLFSLKLQRDNRKNALAVVPAKGKTGKKLYFSPHCGDETTTCYNKAQLYAFSSIFPLAGSMTRGFYWLFLWNFKEKSINRFLMAQPFP